MYDTNVSVPDITAQRYTVEEKFRLLKNYLYELGDVLSLSACNISSENLVPELRGAVEKGKTAEKNTAELKIEQLKRFSALKSDILRTASEITAACNIAVERSKTEILQTADSLYTAKSEFGEYIENASSSISQNAAAIALETENRESVETDLAAYKHDNNANIELKSDALLLQVENIFASKNELGEKISEVSSQITQTAGDITEVFKNETSELKNDLSTLGGSVRDMVSSLDVYIRRGELETGVYGIEIGRSDSNIKARFTNDRLSFYQGAAEVAYISGSSLYITRGEFLDYLKIGNSTDGFFTFDVTQNGLEVGWTNGN